VKSKFKHIRTKSPALKKLYTPEVAEIAKEMIIEGELKTDIAKYLGIHQNMIGFLVKKNPEFEQKLQEGYEILWQWLGIRLIEMATEGLSKVECASRFGIPISTFRKWINDENRLKPYWEIAYTESFSWWWRQAREVISDPKKSKSAAVMIIFSMKKIFGLFDTVEMDDLADKLSGAGYSKEERDKIEYRIKKLVRYEIESSQTITSQDNKQITDESSSGP
jgi:hypothetical protein